MCSPDDRPLPLESISPDEKLPLLVVGDGSDCGPSPCGEEGRTCRGTLKWLAFDDELNPVPPALVVVNPFVTGVSVVPVVADGLVTDAPVAPEGLVWFRFGRRSKLEPPNRGFCLTAFSSGGGDSGGDVVTWYICMCVCMYTCVHVHGTFYKTSSMIVKVRELRG